MKIKKHRKVPGLEKYYTTINNMVIVSVYYLLVSKVKIKSSI